MPQPQSTSIAPDPAEAERGSGNLWWLIALVALVALAGGIYLWRRRTRPLGLPSPDETEADPAPTAPPSPAPSAVPLPPPIAPVAPVQPSHRPAIQVDLRPTRAGLNLLSAIVEGELVVRNEGEAPIENIAIASALLSAHREGDADLTAFLTQPIGRPMVPAFTLAPGEARSLRLVAPLARAGIRAMEAGGRPIFVPIVAIACRFISRGDDFHAARAFAIGVERVDSTKLAPIWLDTPPRMTDTVAARPHPLPAGVF